MPFNTMCKLIYYLYVALLIDLSKNPSKLEVGKSFQPLAIFSL
ncbi:hypothetical protein NEOC95_001103 [Neochlamydia sp. AcF95]|nr:hypothetical protein [Neochlamydia sp. AcF95]